MFHMERMSVCMVPRMEKSLTPAWNSKANMAGAQRASAGVMGGKAQVSWEVKLMAGWAEIRLKTMSVCLYPKTNERSLQNFK